ncbi:MAG: hypothetical protein GY810_19685 [Aureispira sp.]|nr:hypothetical protein [Aureispira sp.]
MKREMYLLGALILLLSIGGSLVNAFYDTPKLFSDNSFLKGLTTKLEKHHNHHKPDKVYVQLDRNFYRPGEDIWAKAYVRDAQTLKPSEKSGVVYLELIDPQGTTIKKLTLLTNKGGAKGDFTLAANAKGGQYQIKAYTSWQKNTKEAFVRDVQVQNVVLPNLNMKLDFEQKAYGAGDEVVARLDLNSLDKKALAEHDFNFVVSIEGKEVKKSISKTGDIGRAYIRFDLPKKLTTNDGLLNIMLQYKGQTESISRSIPIVLGNVDLQFFPEGGQLIGGLPCKVGLKALNEFGKAADIEGQIEDEYGTVIKTFSSYYMGMGNVEFTPIYGKQYFAKITKPVNIKKGYKLPTVQDHGYTIKVTKQNKNFIDVAVQSTNNRELHLVAQNGGKIYFTKTIQAHKGVNLVNIPTKTFPIGITHLTLFNGNKQARAERLIFVHKHKQLNVKVKTDKEKYLPREKVKMDIEVTDEAGQPVAGNFSLAVADDNLLTFADDKQGHILSHLLVESDLKGKIEEPKFYFDDEKDPKCVKPEIDRHEALDNLLLTQGWSRFTWTDVQASKKQKIEFAAENYALKGTVLDFNGKPIKGAKVTAVDDNIVVHTNKEGKFSIVGADMTMSSTLRVEAEGYNSSVLGGNQNGNIQDLKISLIKGKWVTGKVLNKKTKKPLSNTYVYLMDKKGQYYNYYQKFQASNRGYNQYNNYSNYASSTYVDAGGNFRIFVPEDGAKFKVYPQNRYGRTRHVIKNVDIPEGDKVTIELMDMATARKEDKAAWKSTATQLLGYGENSNLTTAQVEQYYKRSFGTDGSSATVGNNVVTDPVEDVPTDDIYIEEELDEMQVEPEVFAVTTNAGAVAPPSPPMTIETADIETMTPGIATQDLADETVASGTRARTLSRNKKATQQTNRRQEKGREDVATKDVKLAAVTKGEANLATQDELSDQEFQQAMKRKLKEQDFGGGASGITHNHGQGYKTLVNGKKPYQNRHRVVKRMPRLASVKYSDDRVWSEQDMKKESDKKLLEFIYENLDFYKNVDENIKKTTLKACLRVAADGKVQFPSNNRYRGQQEQKLLKQIQKAVQELPELLPAVNINNNPFALDMYVTIHFDPNKTTEELVKEIGDKDLPITYASFTYPRYRHYRFVPTREFYSPQYVAKKEVTVRNDFRSTVYWNPMVETNAEGKASVEFYNSDDITQFRVTIEGVSHAGQVGRTEYKYFTQLPFELLTKVPDEVLTGDQVRIPLTLTNNTDALIEGDLIVQAPENFELVKKADKQLEVAAGKSETIYLDYKVLDQTMKGTFRIGFKAQGLSDITTTSIKTKSRGFPVNEVFSGDKLSQSFNIEITEVLSNSLTATLTTYPSVMDEIASSAEKMIRMPGGCFEQTSSSLYPSILALTLLQETGNSNPAIETKARAALKQGYKILSGYQTSVGGYHLWGSAPVNEVLSSYGLIEFTDMAKVFDVDEPARIGRDLKWLMSQRDGNGSWKGNTLRTESWSFTNNDMRDAYIVWAFCSTGNGDKIKKEIEKSYKHAVKSEDPYIMALMANALFEVKDNRRANELLDEILTMQEKDGGFTGKSSMTYSGGRSLKVETTALTTLAMVSSGKNKKELVEAVEFIQKSKSYYGYGSTQGTIFALKALIAFAKNYGTAKEDGTLEVLVDGKKVESIPYEVKGKRLEIPNFEQYLKEGKQNVEIRFAKTKTAIPFDLEIEYTTRQPRNTKNCVLALTTTINKTSPKMGETVRLTAKAQNITSKDQPMLMMMVGIPAGLSIQPWQLKELEEKGVFNYYEVFDGYVVLHYDGVRAKQAKTVNLDLKADIPGQFEAPASSAFLYYHNEERVWSKPETITIDS